MEFETGRRSTLAKLQLSVQGLAGSLNSAKKVLVASTVLTAAFCGAVFGLTLVANEASKESHVSNGLLTTVNGDVVKTAINKGYTSLSEMSAEAIAESDFVSFSQDGADRYMQILGVQSTASKKVINTIVGAFEVTEEGMTFAGDNTVLEATEADKAARKAQCKFCENGRNTQCNICMNGGRAFAVAGRNALCAVCTNGRNLQCEVCRNNRGRNAQCQICSNNGRANQCVLCSNGRNAQCLVCRNGQGRAAKCFMCANAGRNAQQKGGLEEPTELALNQQWGIYSDTDNFGEFGATELDAQMACEDADATYLDSTGMGNEFAEDKIHTQWDIVGGGEDSNGHVKAIIFDPESGFNPHEEASNIDHAIACRFNDEGSCYGLTW